MKAYRSLTASRATWSLVVLAATACGRSGQRADAGADLGSTVGSGGTTGAGGSATAGAGGGALGGVSGFDGGNAGDGGRASEGSAGVGGRVAGAGGGAGSGAAAGSGGGTGSGGAAGHGGAGVAGTGTAGSTGAGGNGPLTNDRCARPARLQFTDARATVTSDTSAATDEFPTLDCGGRGLAGPLTGPQRYYVFTARAGFDYEIRLQPGSGDYFTDVAYVFPASAGCTVEALQSACRTEGVGAASQVPNGWYHFIPQAAGDYIVGVDNDWKGPGGPFTLTILEYCGPSTSSATVCKKQLCTAGRPACDGYVETACNDDGTAYAGSRNDCTTNAQTCCGVGPVFDDVGRAKLRYSVATAPSGTILDFYSVAKSRQLTEIRPVEVHADTDVELTWLVYEATAERGPYTNILSKTTLSAGKSASNSSGPISVPLVAGRFYAIGLGWTTSVTYDFTQEAIRPNFPQATFFGQLISAKGFDTGPANTTVTFGAPDTYVYPQQLTTKL